ncbi:hypothetical protein BDN72DRAFT_260953 [Pluteus cervinus]|uniref:Uncharacterized protein n=1 Tax=Pluteus cervinus TaxID=181527 RepID=A0ACD3AFW4_9AGAR|nr:hypothetical protein BDN72DRAFT_260953 [Pluteus cervinus]
MFCPGSCLLRTILTLQSTNPSLLFVYPPWRQSTPPHQIRLPSASSFHDFLRSPSTMRTSIIQSNLLLCLWANTFFLLLIFSFSFFIFHLSSVPLEHWRIRVIIVRRGLYISLVGTQVLETGAPSPYASLLPLLHPHHQQKKMAGGIFQ